MSGAEIVAEIERETGGRWKPSPGSIYPLLAWFQEKGYSKELPRDARGMKRYELTEKGARFFQEQVRLGERLKQKLEFLAPMLVGGFGLGGNSKELRAVREPARRFIETLLDLRRVAQENPDDLTVAEVVAVLNEGTSKLRGIIERIKER